MLAPHSTHSWIGGFAGRLLQIRPRMGVGSAVTCAVTCIHHASGIEPRRAAELFALAHPEGSLFQTRRAVPATGPRTVKAEWRSLWAGSGLLNSRRDRVASSVGAR
jgi:hypothetical protein